MFNEYLSDDYQETRIPVIEERIMYGGARLAALIEDIYGSDSIAQTNEKFNNMVEAFLQ